MVRWHVQSPVGGDVFQALYGQHVRSGVFGGLRSRKRRLQGEGGVEDSGKGMTREEWIEKFEAMSIQEITTLFGALSDYLLSDAFKRRSCGIVLGALLDE